MTRLRHRFATHEFGELDVHVRSLRDTQEFQDDAGEASDLGIYEAQWALFGVLWASSDALARLMSHYDVAGRRILEVGCGLGMASLVLTQRHSDITATDQHPEAEAYLAFNAALNGHEPVPFTRTGWIDDDDQLGRFDLIIGSDLLYERDHPALLAAFIDRHAAPTCEVLLADGGRGGLGRFARALEACGFTRCAAIERHPDDPVDPLGRPIARFQRRVTET